MKRKTTLTAEQKEKVYFKKLLTVIRMNFSMQSPHARAYRAERKTKNSEGLEVYECERCRYYFAKSHTNLDHIETIGKSPDTLEDLLVCIKKTITNNLQILCKPCHNNKTNKEDNPKTRKTKEDNAKNKRMKAPRLKKVS